MGALGTFDVRELSDEALEQIVFGKPPNLAADCRKRSGRKTLAPVLQAVVSTSTNNTDQPSTG